ncbi:MAG: 4a-hydroxytetrahydrobiopterin dehydratase [Sinimarinibacterium flocculans]|uniref:Putative pterin-4-alpha-carbinolamine dehydratase n=1 Tax=Sinimarinibacterium flocculans TaxID=985250 RepID=A0A318EQ18_9GAMM|nr:4a-hydroxytetrahydrobiopterin dehydratase [Sinimarinibacterium flocculans]MEC9362029.1 4a-hydroxytetrahydrobiopterin dehydratase [Pseudomonadota bacterium]PXV71576.1 pterin-4-alpha-carbinolamine dehydratase [Sinimarinibacterium flocculans]
MSDLSKKHCVPCEGGVPPLDLAAATTLRKQLHERWRIVEDGKAIAGNFSFDNYWQTTAFVNAVAWIAHTQDHHPDISFGYKNASVRYSTHAVDGLSENDFICAAKIDTLLS